MKKYKLLKDDFIEWSGTRLYRIEACKSFEDVAKGTLGGYIEKEENLSHEGNCWVYEGAKVWGNAKICNNAKILGSAEICDNAVIRDNAYVINAKVFENALIRGNAYIRDNARVYGKALVQAFAIIAENAEIYGLAQVYNSARIFGNAKVYDRAKVGGNFTASGDARIYGKAKVMYGSLTKDIKEDLIQYIACSLNIYPANGKYILYKRVNKKANGMYTSLFDPYFIYRDGEYAEVKNPDLDFLESCSSGIHVSTPFYWDKGDTLIAVEVDIADVITCMEGKLRCKRVKVLGEV